MELAEITQLVAKHNNLIFGEEGIHNITVNVAENTIKFTTDTMYYTMSKKLEEVMERLFAEFGVINFKVQFHNHEGNWHDKTIFLEIRNPKKMPEIIKFIQDNFYSVGEWIVLL